MTKSDVWKRIETSARYLQAALGRETLPSTLVVLGSGFRGFEERLTDAKTLDLSEVPHFAVPSVEGHGASLVVGRLGKREVAVMTGRVHLYEGYSADQVVYPIRVLSTVGVQNILLTNAAGSVDPAIRPGTIVSLKDQINLTGTNCLIGADARELGPIFLDMSECYHAGWRAKIVENGGTVDGIYGGCVGPTYETPAETAMLRGYGANVVGMSTVLECIAAHHLQLRVAGLSFVTNMTGGLGGKLSHTEVLDLAFKHRVKLHDLLSHAVSIDL